MKYTRNLPILPALSLLSIVFLYGSAHGAVTVSGSAGTIIDWDGPGWSSDPSEPGSADAVVINQEKVVNVTSAGNQALSVTVGNTIAAYNASYLNVNSGGGLTVGALTLASNSDAGVANVNGGTLSNNGIATINATGTLNVAGGAYVSPSSGSRTIATGAGEINVSSGSFTAQGGAATHALTLRVGSVNISGGTFDMTGGQIVPLDNPTITISGDAATIKMDRLNANSATRAITVNFEFGSTGISTIVDEANAFANLDYLSISVDGSAYSGGAATFNLFTGANISNDFNTANLTVTGLGTEGVDWNWLAEMDGNGGDFLAIQVVPEPSTVALYFGFGALGLVFLRRRIKQ